MVKMKTLLSEKSKGKELKNKEVLTSETHQEIKNLLSHNLAVLVITYHHNTYLQIKVMVYTITQAQEAF